MSIRVEVLPFIGVAVVVGLVIALVGGWASGNWTKAIVGAAAVAAVLSVYFCYFFRDPDRTPPADPKAIVAGADGVIAQIVEVREDRFMHEDTVRVSIFLSLFDVHVNRTPIAGMSTFKGYFPGRHLFTFKDKSSEVNQHNAILIEGSGTRCLVTQIVGPVARRVVYWPSHDRPEKLEKGFPIGMMKFGSRLDMYFPKGDVRLLVQKGDRVRAGETIVATLTREIAR